jgi:integrase
MATFNFTEQGIKALKSGDRPRIDYWDEKVSGFGVRVSDSGRKTWFFFYRLNGIKRRYTFGTYPTIGLAEARDKAKIARHQFENGMDPSADKQANREAETFQELADLFIVRHAMVKKRTWQDDQRNLNKDILPDWKNLKAKDITRKQVSQLLAKVKSRGVKVHDNRIFAIVRKIFNFGIQQGILPPNTNPCQGMEKPSEETSRDRYLSDGEIQKVWKSIETQRPLIQAYFKLCILLAQRSGEVRSMEWSELDLVTGMWSLPGAKTKNKRPHKVPLCRQALEILSSISFTKEKSKWVFPNPRNAAKPMCNTQKALQRVRAGSEITNVDSSREDISWFVGHDFRRSSATHMGRLGVPRFIVKRVLNHIGKSDITEVYDRYDYEAEKRKALEKWADHVDKVVTATGILATVHSISQPLEGEAPVAQESSTAV